MGILVRIIYGIIICIVYKDITTFSSCKGKKIIKKIVKNIIIEISTFIYELPTLKNITIMTSVYVSLM